MSDLQPHPRLHDVQVDDPSVTRVVHRRVDARAVERLTRSSGIATSVSVVVPVGGAAGRAIVDGLGSWDPSGVRVEVLVTEHADDPGRTTLRDRLARSGRSWRVIERPMGGRAAALAVAASGADQDFLVVPGGADSPFDGIASALCHMWAEGCDAAMVDGGDPVRAVDLNGCAPVDPSADLAAWLGLSGIPVGGRLVVLRRWVARWLFNEITRAIDPGEEVADRARLLGMGIVRVDSLVREPALRVQSD